MPQFSIGDLVCDNLGREGIVFSPSKRPSMKWLNEQEDARMPSASGPWWNVLPLDGGGVLVPEDLAVVVRRATVDDVARVMASDRTDGGQATLRHLFDRLCR